MKTQEIEKYIEMRNTGNYDLMWFYKHYMDNSQDPDMNVNKFQMLFQTINLDNIIEHIDDKFKLDKLYDKDGKFIKCYLSSN